MTSRGTQLQENGRIRAEWHLHRLEQRRRPAPAPGRRGHHVYVFNL